MKVIVSTTWGSYLISRRKLAEFNKDLSVLDRPGDLDYYCRKQDKFIAKWFNYYVIPEV